MLDARRFPAEPVGGRFQPGAGQARARKRRVVSGYLHRAVAGRLHRSECAAVAAHQLRVARAGAGAARSASKGGPTAVLTHGANPGLVSHFVKQALLNIAADTAVDAGNPKTREEWAALAAKLGVKVIHIAERDTQVANTPKKLERVRQHLVGGRLRQRRLPAGRAGLGHAREGTAAARPSSRLRPAERDLSDAAGRRHARAHVDAEGRARSTAS